MTNQTVGFAPEFYVIGVVKGGTTSLYSYLKQHPGIFLPNIKETNHFAQEDINHASFLPGYARDVSIDLDAYIRSGMKNTVHIAHVDKKAHYEAIYSEAEAGQVRGDVSNSYMVCPSAVGAIHAARPDAKCIVILRNPISRIWSQYLMNLREAKEELSFKEAILQDAQQQTQGWGVNHQYLALGDYAKQLAPFCDSFGPEHIHVVFYEDYRSEPMRVLHSICAFLGVDKDYEFDIATERNKAALPKSAALNKALTQSGLIHRLKTMVPEGMKEKAKSLLYSDKHLPSISDEDRQFLVDHYRSEVEALGRLIAQDPKQYWPEFAVA